MEAVKIFASTSGLRPFNIGRVSFILATTVAALVIAKLVNAYLFCGFNAHFYADLPVGIALLIFYSITPLLGLAIKPTTKCGRCSAFVYIWFMWGSCCATIAMAQMPLLTLGREDADVDPFNVCGDRSIKATKAQFSNMMPTFELVQRIDVIFKLLVAIGWIFPTVFGFAAAWLSLISFHGSWLKLKARAAEERKSEVCSVDVRMENLRNEINEPGSNAEPQFEEANESEFSHVNEEEEGTAATATTEVSK